MGNYYNCNIEEYISHFIAYSILLHHKQFMYCNLALVTIVSVIMEMRAYAVDGALRENNARRYNIKLFT